MVGSKNGRYGLNSRMVKTSNQQATVYQDSGNNQYVGVTVTGSLGKYTLYTKDDGIHLWSTPQQKDIYVVKPHSQSVGSFVYFDDVTANYVNINANSYGEFQYSTTKLGLPSGAFLMGWTVMCDRNKNFIVQPVSSGSGYWTFRFVNQSTSVQKIGGLVLIGTYIKVS